MFSVSLRKSTLLTALGASLALGLLSGCVPLVIGGAGTAILAAEDRRSTGAFVDDEAIEASALAKVKNRFNQQVHVNITSYNRSALITGEALTEDIRRGVAEEVSRVSGVVRVYNEMSVGPSASLTSIGNDTAITAGVKTQFLRDSRFQTNHVKVVTEAGVVYLLGIVTRSEGDAASEVASRVKGVRRVVRYFEYQN